MPRMFQRYANNCLSLCCVPVTGRKRDSEKTLRAKKFVEIREPRLPSEKSDVDLLISGQIRFLYPFLWIFQFERQVKLYCTGCHWLGGKIRNWGDSISWNITLNLNVWIWLTKELESIFLKTMPRSIYSYSTISIYFSTTIYFIRNCTVFIVAFFQLKGMFLGNQVPNQKMFSYIFYFYSFIITHFRILPSVQWHPVYVYQVTRLYMNETEAGFSHSPN